ncbi:hypothetical protein COOONC_01151, partial [Cooperia oncophora]
MDPSHLLDEVADADSMAAEVKPTVATSVSAGDGSVEVLHETSGSAENPAVVHVVEDVPMEGSSSDAPAGEDHSDVQSLLSEIDMQKAISKRSCSTSRRSVENWLPECELQSQSPDANERSRLYRQLEASRNELAMKKMTVDCDLERLKHEKEERDNAIRTLTKEKHLIATENFALKDELQKALNEKAVLMQEKSSIDQEMRTLSAERERARAESEMYANSRKWFLEEIAQK